MKPRFLVVAVLAATTFAVPVVAQEKKAGPAIVAQAAPLGRVLGDVKTVVKLVAGLKGDEAVKAFDEKLKEGLGANGFTGADLTRPPAAYFEVKDPVEKSYGFLLIPVTGEEEFIDLLSRIIPDDPLEVTPVKGNKGLYRIESEKGEADVPVRLRFKDEYAYIGLNTPDDLMAADKLVPPGDLIVPTETALFAYRGYIGRYPAPMKKAVSDAIEKLGEQANDDSQPEKMKDATKQILGWYKRILEQLVGEGDVGTYRIDLDPRTGEVSVEAGLTGRAGTQLAKDIAARKPSTNRFAGLLGDDTTAGFLMQLPLFAPELQEGLGGAFLFGLKSGFEQTGDKPKEVAEVFAQAVDGLERTFKTGEFDLAAALTGPDANGLFGAAAAISFEDTAGLEKALRALYATAPEEIQNMVKLDAAKVGDVSVHRVPLGLFLPAEAKKVFGDKASVSLALAPKGIYVTFGPDSLAMLKAALGKKPSEAKAVDMQMNPVRLGKLLKATAKPGAELYPQLMQDVFGVSEDRLISVCGLAVEGGDSLKLRFTVNVIPFARITMLGASATPMPVE